MFRSNLNDLLITSLNLHLLIHEYTWSQKNNKWEKNINEFSYQEYKNNIKYFSKVILEWRKGLKNREKLDKAFKKKFLN